MLLASLTDQVTQFGVGLLKIFSALLTDCQALP